MSESESNFVPNVEIMEAMLAMGISKHEAEIALYKTGNDSADAAVSYVFDNLNEPQGEVEDHSDRYKMVFVVNSSLNMSMGKTAAQVAHACLGLYRNIKDNEQSLSTWEDAGQKKIVLKGENHLHLLDLQSQAALHNLPSYIVQDAGATEIPAGSLTVLSIFGREEAVNKVTGNLNLL